MSTPADPADIPMDSVDIQCHETMLPISPFEQEQSCPKSRSIATSGGTATATRSEVVEVSRAHHEETRSASTTIHQSASGGPNVQVTEETETPVKWLKIRDTLSPGSQHPKARHGHRAVAYGTSIIVYGGGSGHMMDGVHVYDTCTKFWLKVDLKGDIPKGRAACGMVLDNTRILIHGGMLDVDVDIFSDELYELNVLNWTWTKLSHLESSSSLPPCGRFGHSFTKLADSVALFGGLARANPEGDLRDMGICWVPRHLNDFYVLKLNSNGSCVWGAPSTFGCPPSPRESHSAVAYVTEDGQHNKLIIYGGMNGWRLGDLYVLDVDTLMWCKPTLTGNIPHPRSLHTATLIGHRMYVFGGMVPTTDEDNMDYQDLKTKWKCDNLLSCLNVITYNWELVQHHEQSSFGDVDSPKERAGHSAVHIDSSIYIWAGRDGFKLADDGAQLCYDELWQLDVQIPEPADATKGSKMNLNNYNVTCRNYESIKTPQNPLSHATEEDDEIIEIFRKTVQVPGSAGKTTTTPFKMRTPSNAQTQPPSVAPPISSILGFSKISVLINNNRGPSLANSSRLGCQPRQRPPASRQSGTYLKSPGCQYFTVNQTPQVKVHNRLPVHLVSRLTDSDVTSLLGPSPRYTLPAPHANILSRALPSQPPMISQPPHHQLADSNSNRPILHYQLAGGVANGPRNGIPIQQLQRMRIVVPTLPTYRSGVVPRTSNGSSVIRPQIQDYRQPQPVRYSLLARQGEILTVPAGVVPDDRAQQHIPGFGALEQQPNVNPRIFRKALPLRFNPVPYGTAPPPRIDQGASSFNLRAPHVGYSTQQLILLPEHHTNPSALAGCTLSTEPSPLENRESTRAQPPHPRNISPGRELEQNAIETLVAFGKPRRTSDALGDSLTPNEFR